MLVKSYFFAGAAFDAADFAAAFSVGLVTFSGLAAVAVVAFFTVFVFLGLAAFAANICFLRLSNSSLVFTAGTDFGSLSYTEKNFCQILCKTSIIKYWNRNVLHASRPE